MWEKRKLRLAAIMFTAVYYRVTGEIILDMAKDAVDDQYEGCRKEAMEKFIHLGLLEQEMKNNTDFQNAWKKNSCPKPIPGEIQEHTTALSAYGDGDSNFIKDFNSAVKEGGSNLTTYEQFTFKSFHFLLMDSLMQLRTNKCMNIFFVTEKEYTANIGSKVRFGTFNTGYLNYSQLKKFCDLDEMVVFKVYSCFFINLGDKACSKDMALFSPAEVFTVEDLTEIKDDDDDAEYTEIVLKHSGMHSNHNCFFLSRSPANVSTKWLVSLFVALFLFFF